MGTHFTRLWLVCAKQRERCLVHSENVTYVTQYNCHCP